MKILVLNCGSSSIKYQLVDMARDGEVMAKGLVERIGLANGELTHKPIHKETFRLTSDIPDHEVGIKLILESLLHHEHGVITDKTEIVAAGHRVAHGGNFKASVFVDETAKIEIERCFELAPLHNPANLSGVLSMEKLLPGLPQVAVFDTSFHQTMPEHSFLYGLPYEYYEKYKLRRYGFHGTSHKFVAEKAAGILGKNWKDMNIITCHLGNGSSIAAIRKGESIDTSMGFTPNEGLIMGTRTGDLDLGALLFIMEKEKLDLAQANNLINKKSGVMGVSGLSYDMRDLENASKDGHHRAQVAVKMFAYRVKKYIGAYIAAIGGLDLLLFTGGIGENDSKVRELVCENMEYLGISFDKEKNFGLRGKDDVISAPGSKVTVMTVTTNEEFVIARDTYEIITKRNGM
jgi:acetate kinase